jgi:hypothetical protein
MNPSPNRPPLDPEPIDPAALLRAWRRVVELPRRNDASNREET